MYPKGKTLRILVVFVFKKNASEVIRLSAFILLKDRFLPV